MPKTFVFDENPQPDEVPPRGTFTAGQGRPRDPEYLRLQSRLALNPGVDHKIAVLQATTPKETKHARRVASGLRSTLKRYNVKMTERKRDGVVVIWGRYDNGTTP
jgi:hypothetical protein